jgi:hypothetical protein
VFDKFFILFVNLSLYIVLAGLLDRSGYAERYAEEARQADRKYNRLPQGFSSEILSWVPRGYTLQVREYYL